MTRLPDAVFAASHGATAIGFVFYQNSPRYLRPIDAAKLSAVIPRHVARVGVFVNADTAEIKQTAADVRLDVVQLHGEETPEDCSRLDGLRVWKSFAVTPGFQPEILSQYPVEAFLLDSPPRDGLPGGTGEVFPWPKAAEAKRFGKVIVAGGLDGENVAEVIRRIDPWGVDASSKLETAPGAKDPAKVSAYLEAAQHSLE